MLSNVGENSAHRYAQVGFWLSTRDKMVVFYPKATNRGVAKNNFCTYIIPPLGMRCDRENRTKHGSQ